MTGYSTLDISGIRIVGEKRRRDSLEEKKDKRKREAARTHDGRTMLAVLTTVALVLAAVVFGSSQFTSYCVTGSGAPRAIIEFCEKYPEAADFALDWDKYHNGSGSIDISAEVHEGEIPLFIQWDKRWGYRVYGSGQFLGFTGCGPTCLSMVYSGLTGNTDMNPYNMAKFSEDGGYYVLGSGTSWSFMTEGASELGLKSKQLNSEKALRKALAKGRPVIASMGPGDFTNAGHFIVFTGLSEDGKLMVNDPNSPSNSKKTWDMDEVYPQIKNMWAFSV